MKKLFVLACSAFVVACSTEHGKNDNSHLRENTTTESENEEEVVTVEKEPANGVAIAAQHIHGCFYKYDPAAEKSMEEYLAADSIKITTEHSISGDIEVVYLSGKKKMQFFIQPKKLHPYTNRKKTKYLREKGDCAEFEPEGLLHNTLYIQKLCFKRDKEQLLLSEIFLLDGD